MKKIAMIFCIILVASLIKVVIRNIMESHSLSPYTEVHTINNQNVTKTAAAVYGFVLANDYKAVKWCAKHYPVNNLKNKFDKQFSSKKIKAMNIIEKNIGHKGLKQIILSLEKTDIQALFLQQIDSDYQSIKKDFYEEGITNFSKKQYCMFLDDNADDLIEIEKHKFKELFQDF